MALAFCLAISACGLEEPYNNSSDKAGVIEFVPRQIGYNNQSVETKSEANAFEKEIHNCFFLLFDNSTGARINTPENLVGSDATTLPTQLIKLDKVNATSVTACFIANVPEDFAKGIKGLNKPSVQDNPNAKDNEYLYTAILDITYATGGTIGTPTLNLNGDGSTMTDCIPMMGMKSDINLSPTSTNTIAIDIKRIFAKVTANISMDLADTGILGVQTNTYYELLSYAICNLPAKLRICEPNENSQSYETSWWEEKYSNAYEVDQIRNTDNVKIYNAGAVGNDYSKSYSISVYVPEYYLLALSEAEFNTTHKDNPKFSSFEYNTQECKPLMYESTTKRPVYLKLIGSYKQATGAQAGLQYEIYLGENNSSSFTLKRNKHYTNNITIRGVENTDFDWRVTVTNGNDLISIYGEVANCYIISGAQEYNFKAYKGAYKYNQLSNARKCNGSTVQIIAQDKNSVTLENPSNPFTVTDGDDGVKIISFKVNDITFDCNMVIAMMNGDAIEWTWHLWFIKEIGMGNMGFFEMSNQTFPDNITKMGDSNLGVIREVYGDWIGGGAIGFYYKYGHRTPYFKDNVVGSGEDYHGFNENDYSSWDVDTKASTDPCPPGYKVPSSDVWMKENYKSAILEDAEFMLGKLGINALRFWDQGTSTTTDDIYYPYSGYIPKPSSGYDAVPYTLNTQANKEVKGEESNVTYENYSRVEQILGAGERDKKCTYTKYSDFKYKITVKPDKLGQLAISDEGKVISYGYASVNKNTFKNLCEFISCKKTVYEVSVEEVGAAGIWTEKSSTRKETLKSSQTISSTSQLPSDWLDKLADDQCSYDAIKVKTHKEIVSFGKADSNDDYGYQVRCVRE